MQRNYKEQAIIISLKENGENNSLVTLLTASRGIIYAVLYGGPKSRLKSLVVPWHSGLIYLYDNQEKNHIKICDFEVYNYHESFRLNLFKMYAASLAAEVIIKTHCSGSYEESFRLISGFLDGMELSNEEQSRLGLLRFIWRYLELMGIQPDASCCDKCGKSFFNSQIADNEQSYYNNIDNNFICRDCFDNSEHNLVVGTETVKYLAGITLLTPSQVRMQKISKNGYEEMKSLLYFLLQKNLETKLNSLDTGMGIL